MQFTGDENGQDVKFSISGCMSASELACIYRGVYISPVHAGEVMMFIGMGEEIIHQNL